MREHDVFILCTYSETPDLNYQSTPYVLGTLVVYPQRTGLIFLLCKRTEHCGNDR